MPARPAAPVGSDKACRTPEGISCSAAFPEVVCVAPGEPTGEVSPEVRNALENLERNVNNTRSIEEVIDFVWQATSGIIPRDRIGLAFMDDEGSRVTARYAKTDYPDVRLGIDYSEPLTGSSLGHLIHCGKIRIISDLEAYLKSRPESKSTKLLLNEGVRTSITLPLLVDGRQIGFMFFSSRDPGVYEVRHARILMAVLSRISQAVEKAWIINRLEEANRNYNQSLGFVAHELKSPLSGMISRGLTYTEGLTGKVEKRAATTIGSMIRTAGYLMDMITEYLDLARLESGELRYEPRDGVRFMEDVVRTAAESVGQNAARRGSSLDFEAPAAPVVVRGDAALLTILLTNLFDNAIKYGHEKQRVKVAVWLEDSWLKVRVRNKGLGFTPEQALKLFRKFSRLHQRGLEDRRGTGLGLYLSGWIAHKHGARIDAASEPDQWAEFTLSLPGARLGT